MQTVSSTPSASDFSIAAAAMRRASFNSSLNEFLILPSCPVWFRVSTNCSSEPWRTAAGSAAAIDGFDLGIKLQSGAAGFPEGRGARPLQAAERRVDQIAGGRAIDLDRSGFDITREFMHVTWIARRDRSRKAVFSVIRLCDGVGVTFNLYDCED